MDRRHGADDEQNRRNRTRRYSDDRDYDRGGPGGSGYERGSYGRRGYPDEPRYGPYYDARGNLYYEDDRGNRHYDEGHEDAYYRGRYDERRGYEDYRYDRDRRDHETTRNQKVKWTGIVLVALICGVVLVIVSYSLLGDPSQSAQPGLAQPLPSQQQAPQPVAPQQPQAPAAPSAPVAPDYSEELEGVRGELQDLRYVVADIRAYLEDLFSSQEGEQG